MNFFDNKVVLITGGTGSFGKKMIYKILTEHNPRKVIVFSRDELKQFEMQQDTRFNNPDVMRFFLGDVRDKERLARAFDGVDYVVHAAALKQVPAVEYNPFEAVKTNILGAQNIIECAIDKGVERVIALSTDKAANPINFYGATKLCSDKLFVGGNFYSGAHDTSFMVVRYGNVVGSRGSVIPFFLRKRKEGVLPITDKRMTRFWITLEQGVDFVIHCLKIGKGGELFVPKIPSMRLLDLAAAIAPECRQQDIGIRPGEKLHEVMVPEDDSHNALDLKDSYMIMPSFDWKHREYWMEKGQRCPMGFKYSSDSNSQWLTKEALQEMICKLDFPEAQEFSREQGLKK
jgi:UDP-N-acetylglucosamine 4,6-dehydratase/5-epimerase